MLPNLFALIQVILKGLSLWEAFLDYIAIKHQAEMDERRQRQKQAVEDATKAKTPEEAWRAQEGIIDNEPGSP